MKIKYHLTFSEDSQLPSDIHLYIQYQTEVSTPLTFL